MRSGLWCWRERLHDSGAKVQGKVSNRSNGTIADPIIIAKTGMKKVADPNCSVFGKEGRLIVPKHPIVKPDPVINVGESIC